MHWNFKTELNELDSRLDSAKQTICEVQSKTQEVAIPINEINDNKNNNNKNTHISFLFGFSKSPISQESGCEIWKLFVIIGGSGPIL